MIVHISLHKAVAQDFASHHFCSLFAGASFIRTHPIRIGPLPFILHRHHLHLQVSASFMINSFETMGEILHIASSFVSSLQLECTKCACVVFVVLLDRKGHDILRFTSFLFHASKVLLR